MPTFTDDVIVNPGNFHCVGAGGWNSSGDNALIKFGDEYNAVRANWGGLLQVISPWGWSFDEQRPGVNNTRLRIKNTGEVGVGTSDPQALLDVRGTALFGSSAKSRIYDGATYCSLSAVSDHPMHIDGFSGKPVVLNYLGGGNVGIGKSSPEARLDVFGAIGLTTETTPVGLFLRAKLEGELMSGFASFAKMTILHNPGTGEIAGALRIVNLDGQGIVRCTGSVSALGGLPGLVTLQGANQTLNHLLADDNGRLFLASGLVPNSHIMIDPRPMLQDDFWSLDSSVWSTQVAGGGSSVAASSDTAVGPSGVDLARGGHIKVATGSGATDSARLFAARPFIRSGHARFRCRFYSATYKSGANNLVVELGIKTASAWASKGGAGYYFSFDSTAWGTNDFYMVANNGVSGPVKSAVPDWGLTTMKFFEIEFTVEKAGNDDVVVRAWQSPNYSATTFTLPAGSSPLDADLVPGFAVYNAVAAGQTQYVDLIECETLRSSP